jgi:hypothetical protein
MQIQMGYAEDSGVSGRQGLGTTGLKTLRGAHDMIALSHVHTALLRQVGPERPMLVVPSWPVDQPFQAFL